MEWGDCKLLTSVRGATERQCDRELSVNVEGLVEPQDCES